MLKIDIHTHILPPKLPNWKKEFGYGGFVDLEHHKSGCARMMIDGNFFREIEENCWEPKARLTDCQKNHISVQVVSTVPVMFSYWAKPKDGNDIARFLNDHLAEVVSKNPKNFVGLATLPMQAPDLAVKELERCKRELNLSGIQIGSHINEWNLNDPHLYPVFEAAQNLGMSVFIHPWDMMGAKEMTKYWLPWLVGMPAETSRAICSMIFGGIFEKLPKLRVAFAHGGGAFPGTLARIEHGFRERPDLCGVDNSVSPVESIGKFYVDSLVHDARSLQFILDIFGAERIALGTDYPFPLGEREPGKLIESLNLDAKIKEALFCKTALQWLGLKAEVFLK